MIIIRADELERISIERFTSTSGKWVSILCSGYEPENGNLNAYFIVIVHAGTNRVRKIARIATDPAVAYVRWEEWRHQFGGKSEHTFEEDMPAGLSEFKPSWPVLTEEDRQLELKLKPRGARIFVRDITPIDEVTARAERIIPVIAEENKPKPTMGIVLAVGEDPLAQELYKPGFIVLFSKHAGNTFMEAGQEYRSLELFEIIGYRTAEDGVSDLMPSKPDADSHLGAIEK